MNRNVVIAGSVVLLHVAALWALQAGLLRQAVEIVVPVEVLSQFIEPPAPKVVPPPPAPPVPVQRPVVRAAKPVPAPAPQPVAIQDPTPAPAAPTGVLTPQPPAPPITVPVAAAPAAPPAPPKVEMPSSDAAYLDNPKANYPPLSKRLGEQGKVIVRVYIGADGTPQKAELRKSSGYTRLDNSALDYVMKCRYVPGKVNGVAQAMWHEAPVNFILE
ncbi:energy transducer TonB [Variovorax sp. CYS-02]|uniref:Energy transducer TonB n=2 Tax=Variovorax terrae TaxID=2923278 RepID=A0A9X1VV42_9BURK|nr:energy transducer TonB [Variovorax terrae]MCJ0763798.1 energy transducer TonB [Variovorax terrae]